ncbi:LRP2-binding protein-like isoform X2 [Lineus longissimus]|uniref:LRP2-binding protein-like isoform X2 n=1 Tax=Lineus longissimus TaxID=88925 RepID=UPI00315C9AF4
MAFLEDLGLSKDLSAEKLPKEHDGPMVYHVAATTDNKTLKFKDEKTLSQEELTEKVESVLWEKINSGEKEAFFQLGQLYFEEGRYDESERVFQRVKETDFQVMYQLSIMLYDGLAGRVDYKTALDYMNRISSSTSLRAKHLVHAAQYNIGRAHFQGYGVRRQSDTEAERWWLLAADDGNPRASVKAQTTLGYYYSREESRDLKKAFFWHSEACGNGSLESQGALGVMYLSGLGVKKDLDSAFECLKEASERGNVYAMGHLTMYYYNKKLFTKAAELSSRVSQLKDVSEIAEETDCLPGYVAKGIAIACFIFARCLHHGVGVKHDSEKAKMYYSRSFHFDPDMCARLQNITTHGRI